MLRDKKIWQFCERFVCNKPGGKYQKVMLVTDLDPLQGQTEGKVETIGNSERYLGDGAFENKGIKMDDKY
jgi:hypothetical protein